MSSDVCFPTGNRIVQKTSLERAYEMAEMGAFDDVKDLIRGLTKEGYDSRQIEGPQLKKRLLELMKQAAERREALD